MAFDSQPLMLINIPLEVRHQIFQYIAMRDTQPKNLLRYWFEREELKENIAKFRIKNPNTETPRVLFEGDLYEYEYESEDGDHGGEELQGEEDSDEDEDEDFGADNNEEELGRIDTEAQEQNVEMDESDSTADPIIPAPTISTKTQDPATLILASLQQASMSTNQTAFSPSHIAGTVTVAQTSATSIPAFTPPLVQAPTQGKEGNTLEDQGETENENGDPNSDEASKENSEEETNEESSDAGFIKGAAQSSPLAPVITIHRKWRHIPQFMQITHCPPPVELFLTSKQLNDEAISWFYDVAVLRIEATGSFAHTSFFEEAFSQIAEAAFSPIKHIRKVEVAFVWDTTWLRSDQAGCADTIFPALLRQRAIFVVSILMKAPNLHEITIHWHDSAQDDESVDLMNDVLIDFLGLDAQVKVEPHYITPDAKPYKKSIAGRRRIEFQNIVDNGLACLL